ncbi:hypothetical protein AvCA_34230 [Azotobacter vinelandii CA]|uniref:FimV N-terminal domain-containing protein n=2 Tax=Azotobacter vinelandii TaxID=354 RepID=C1DQD6_AZOVD|nr:FimV/HubP family polar landmark protein [Azotobacter vinelandii]ACO79572.1 conserved hypothetical protein [Azotobacter vinelandii DJ]AGK16313.1 hypothetical protein AvCA_34230 [Azotobacter vinelandii CA]AGK21332.1 hypothetical protein AvCA6_34230 [Azotobacter vinelandii CA6]WKN20447.1 FimV family protein [Azotobacter vinelandii]SFX25674.1 pilus assembly protein FimV [Azotobacter vinelandii]
MVRVRKLALAIAAASVLSSGMAHALGLGEVTLRSALNQPLVAEIELLEARDVGAEEIAPALASPDAFDKAGVDRQHFLNDLKFTPIIGPNGKRVIRVTSTKPVREPYLNFLVEVLWPNGRLLREYTLLLDPPLYSSQTAMSAAQKTLPEQRSGAVPRAPAAAAASRPNASRQEATGAAVRKYRTVANDTLWKVAERVRTSGTIHQTMLAIQDLNPQAFLDGNINRLARGQVLRLPDETQIRRRSASEALAEVAAQNAAWREHRARPAVASARQLDATHRTEAGAAPARVETGDSLRLVAADGGKATAGSDQGADGKAAADKLAVAKENLDATQRENAELKSRMNDLQSQLDKLQRLIALKDEQLARLQANLAQSDEAGGGASADLAAGNPVQAQSAVVDAPAAGQAESASDVPARMAVASSDVEASAPAAPPAVVPEQSEAVSAVPVPPSAVVAPSVPPVAEPAADTPQQPAPTEPAAPRPPQSTVASGPTALVDSILSNPLLLPSLGGGAAAALLLGLLVARRRAAKKTDFQDEDDEGGMTDTRLDAGLSRLPVEPTLLNGFSGAGPKRDAVSEAEEHIACGRFKEAAESLEAACAAEPGRSELRLKLMEVRAELGDREGFARQERALRETAGAQSQVDHLKMKYPAMAGFATIALAGSALASGPESSEGAQERPSLAEESEPPQLLAADIGLRLDDLEAELERDLQHSAQDDATSTPGDLTQDEAPRLASPVEEPLIEDFSFDLDLPDEAIDFELDEDPEGISLAPLPLTGPATGDKAFPALDPGAPELPVAALDETLSPEEAFLLEEGLFDGFELPVDDDFSIAPTPEASGFELPSSDGASEGQGVSGLVAQLDELDVELKRLAAGLGEGDTQPAARSQGDPVESEDFDFLADADETATKLDLARAYIDMGDTEGARDILEEVLNEGNEVQRQEAREMSSRLT